jgi:thioredoxin reductase (NADPH)
MADWDVLVAGAGAAGMSAALFAAMEDLRVVVVEELASGGQQLLTEAVANYPGLPHVPGYEISQRMETQAVAAGAVFLNGTVTAISPSSGGFVVATAKDPLRARSVVITTGTERRPLGVPGEKELTGRGVSTCASCDGPLQRGKRIVVVGGGDSACDEAGFLATLTDRVLLVNRRLDFRAQAYLVRRVTGSPNVEIRHETEVIEVVGPDRVTAVRLRDRSRGRDYSEPADALYAFVGSSARVPQVSDLHRDEGGCVITDQRMATSVPGVFAAGAVRSGPFRQYIVAAGEGAIAGHAAAAYARAARELHGR